jgi:uncharacterized protein (DUF2062 family)
LKKLFKKHMPDPHSVARHRGLKVLAPILQDPNMLHFNRRSIPAGVGAGVFAAFIPLPIQTLVAVVVSIFARGNIAVALGFTFVSNPATYAPLYYFCFMLGNFLLGNPEREPISFEMTHLLTNIVTYGKPLMLGCLLMGALCGLLSYFGVSMLWRLHVVRNWDARRIKRKRAKERLRHEEELQRQEMEQGHQTNSASDTDSLP